MEDAARTSNDAADSAVTRTPPPPPEPSADPTPETLNPRDHELSDEPLRLGGEQWDISAISSLAALRMLSDALSTLAEATGDVPPTPPVSRPTTPKKDQAVPFTRRPPSPEESGAMAIGSPEAQPNEPITVEVGEGAEDVQLQRIAIARRFFSKVAPPFSVSEYLMRLHHFCPHSPAVYLAAASYCHRLCVADLMVPATNRTIHRLALASIRVAAKAIEDNKWAQERMAKVGGVSRTQLMNLEVTLCFLLDFDLGVGEKTLAKRMYLLQQAARQGMGAKGKLSDSFRLKLPLRMKAAAAAAAAAAA